MSSLRFDAGAGTSGTTHPPPEAPLVDGRPDMTAQQQIEAANHLVETGRTRRSR